MRELKALEDKEAAFLESLRAAYFEKEDAYKLLEEIE